MIQTLCNNLWMTEFELALKPHNSGCTHSVCLCKRMVVGSSNLHEIIVVQLTWQRRCHAESCHDKKRSVAAGWSYIRHKNIEEKMKGQMKSTESIQKPPPGWTIRNMSESRRECHIFYSALCLAADLAEGFSAFDLQIAFLWRCILYCMLHVMHCVSYCVVACFLEAGLGKNSTSVIPDKIDARCDSWGLRLICKDILFSSFFNKHFNIFQHFSRYCFHMFGRSSICFLGRTCCHRLPISCHFAKSSSCLWWSDMPVVIMEPLFVLHLGLNFGTKSIQIQQIQHRSVRILTTAGILLAFCWTGLRWERATHPSKAGNTKESIDMCRAPFAQGSSGRQRKNMYNR